MMTARYFSDARHAIAISFGSDCITTFVDAKVAAAVDMDSPEYFEACAEAGERGLDVADTLDAILALQAFATQYRS